MLEAVGGLVVGCFGLDLAHDDVFRVGELVLVERVVLDCCADAVRVLIKGGEWKRRIYIGRGDEGTYSQMLPL